MEVRQLQAVEAIARHRHFTRAAEELHVAQSALSRQIARLEAELGLELFERTSRRVQPTAAGEAVAARARRVLAELDSTRAEIDEIRGLTRGSVRIGAMLPAGEINVPELLVRFRARFPGVDVGLREGMAVEMREHLVQDRADVAFWLETDPDPGFETERISVEEVAAAFPPGRAPDGAAVTAEKLARETIVAPRSGSAIRDRLDRFFADVPHHLSLESGDPYFLRCLVSQGFGIAFLPRSLMQTGGPPVEVRSLRPRLELPVVIGWRAGRHHPPAVSAFIDFVRSEGADARW